MFCVFFFFSSRRRHTRWTGDWSSDVCSSDLAHPDREPPASDARGVGASGARRSDRAGGGRGARRAGLPRDRSEERRVGRKSVDLGGRRIIKKKKKKRKCE